MSEPKGNGDSNRTTTELAPIEIEALLHDEASGQSREAGGETVEMIPLVPLDDGEDVEPPEPDRIARGSDAVTVAARLVARGTEPGARKRRTVERLAIADILKRK